MLRHARSHQRSTVPGSGNLAAPPASRTANVDNLIPNTPIMESQATQSSTEAQSGYIEAPQPEPVPDEPVRETPGQAHQPLFIDQSKENASITAAAWPSNDRRIFPSSAEVSNQPELRSTIPIGDCASDSGLPQRNPTNLHSGYDHSIWSPSLPYQHPFWLANEDFDLNMFNSSILDSAVNWIPFADDQHTIHPTSRNNDSSADSTSLKIEDLICQNWFTVQEASKTECGTPDVGPEEAQINEAYRENLAYKLQHHLPSSPLPSTDVMVSFSSAPGC